MKFLLYVTGALTALHGLVHLMGLVAYWPLGTLAELPYKTTLAAGRWAVGAPGMKVFAALWLAAAIGFVLGAAGLLAHRPWWPPVLIAAIALSTLIIALDWGPAFRGAFVNAVILILLALYYVLPGRGVAQ